MIRWRIMQYKTRTVPYIFRRIVHKPWSRWIRRTQRKVPGHHLWYADLHGAEYADLVEYRTVILLVIFVCFTLCAPAILFGITVHTYHAQSHTNIDGHLVLLLEPKRHVEDNHQPIAIGGFRDSVCEFSKADFQRASNATQTGWKTVQYSTVYTHSAYVINSTVYILGYIANTKDGILHPSIHCHLWDMTDRSVAVHRATIMTFGNQTNRRTERFQMALLTCPLSEKVHLPAVMSLDTEPCRLTSDTFMKIDREIPRPKVEDGINTSLSPQIKNQFLSNQRVKSSNSVSYHVCNTPYLNITSLKDESPKILAELLDEHLFVTLFVTECIMHSSGLSEKDHIIEVPVPNVILPRDFNITLQQYLCPRWFGTVHWTGLVGVVVSNGSVTTELMFNDCK